MNECGQFLIRDPNPGIWRRSFDCRGDGAAEEPGLFVEIGCGKGDFIIAKAMDDPANNYLGIEGQESVILRALEKAMWLSGRTVTGEAESDATVDSRGRTTPGGPEADAADDSRGRPAEAGSESDSEPTAGGSEAIRPLGNLRFADIYVKSMKDLFEDASLAGIYLNFSDPWPKARHYKRRLTWRKRLKEYETALKKGGTIEIKTDNDALFEFTLEEIEACGWEPEVMTRDLHGSDLEARLTMTEYEKKYRDEGRHINYLSVTPKKRD